jgi:hypothetical protein
LDQVVTPAHLLFLPIDNFKILNFLNFSDVGASPLHESTAFKKIKMFSKASSFNLTNVSINRNAHFSKLNFYFDNDNFTTVSSLVLGIKRQHNFLNSSALNNASKTFFDSNSSQK